MPLTGTGATATLTPTGAKEDLEDFGSIWNARDVLSDISQSNLLLQRSLDATTGLFSEDAGTKRYMLTWLDRLDTGEVEHPDESMLSPSSESTENPTAT